MKKSWLPVLKLAHPDVRMLYIIHRIESVELECLAANQGMHMLTRLFEKKSEIISVINRTILAVAVVYFSYDIIIDFLTEESRLHIYLEGAIFFLVVLSLSWEIIHRIQARRQLIESEMRLNRVTVDLAERVKSQLNRWKLTASEKEVAWLVIKGFSFSEIALLRGVREKTARQQASVIYSKAQVKGRAEFTALFLEDFLSSPVCDTA